MRLILTVTELWPLTATEVSLDLPEGERNAPMAKLQQAVHFINLSKGDRVQPVIADFAREDHKTTGLQVEIDCPFAGVFKVHSGTALQAKCRENFLEW